jgi:hypothetical protein
MTAAHSYANCISEYFMPNLARQKLEDLTLGDFLEFGLWQWFGLVEAGM